VVASGLAAARVGLIKTSFRLSRRDVAPSAFDAAIFLASSAAPRAAFFCALMITGEILVVTPAFIADITLFISTIVSFQFRVARSVLIRKSHRWRTIDYFAGIICDGIHVDPASLRIAVRCKGPERLMLVTDAMPLVGTQDRQFILHGRQI
jgi:hypothetical protein